MELILLIAGVGLLLLLAEAFVPGGVLGIVGGLALVVAIGMGFVQFGFLAGTILLIGLGGTALVGFAIWMSLFPRTVAGRKFMLSQALAAGAATEDVELAPGTSGVVITALRPVGKARFAERTVEVVAEAEWIEAGATVEVTARDGLRAMVRKKP